MYLITSVLPIESFQLVLKEVPGLGWLFSSDTVKVLLVSRQDVSDHRVQDIGLNVKKMKLKECMCVSQCVCGICMCCVCVYVQHMYLYKSAYTHEGASGSQEDIHLYLVPLFPFGQGHSLES